MITRLEIRGFKCFDSEDINLGALTLLAGANATGKSTVLQAFLLLWQSWDTNQKTVPALHLNGNLINIGTAQEALNSQTKEDEISFRLSNTAGNSALFRFKYPQGTPDARDLLPITISGNSSEIVQRKLIYLQAERVGPRVLYPTGAGELHSGVVGSRGDYAANCIAEAGDLPIANAALAYPGKDNKALRYQTEYWMRDILPGVSLQTETIPRADQVRLSIRNDGRTSDFLRPTNTGFGISYTLPIIVAALTAAPGTLMLVENPEAHLHPASQSRMGRFLALVAHAGVQVIVESHSDHILNGIRLAFRRNTDIPLKDVAIHFFLPEPDNTGTRRITPALFEDGGIKPWPDGFFDQMEKDLLRLL